MTDFTPITDRTKAFAIRTIKACSFLDDNSGVAKTLSNSYCVLVRQLVPMSVNHVPQSDKDFLSKLEIALKEEKPSTG